MKWGLINRCEFAEPKPYGGGEVAVATIACLTWFVAIVVRLGFSPQAWTLIERLIEAASFIVFAGIPVFFLATPAGTKAAKVLLKNSGFGFQALVCLLFIFYIGLVKTLNLNPDRFVWLNQLDTLIINENFWLNTVLFLIGTFVILRIPFLLLKLRDRPKSPSILLTFKQNRELILLLVINFIYVSLVNTSLVSTALKSDNSGYYIGFSYFLVFFCMNLPWVKQSPSRFMLFDFLLTIACVGSLFWFSRPFFSFGVFVGLNLFILAVIFGTGLGREHFGYSFQVRKIDVGYVVKSIAIATLILVPAAVSLRFSTSSYQAPNIHAGVNYLAFLLSYAVLFSFRVGIFEEILFRCGLMVFIRDQIQNWSKQPLDRQRLVLVSAIICSVIFGVGHIGNDPSAGVALSPFIYKTIYAVLATIASLFYSFAFGETNRLWCSIIIHGMVDTTAVVLLGASLTVPF